MFYEKKNILINDSDATLVAWISQSDINIHIQCPYSDKTQVKSLGAKWDNIKKSWYISKSTENYKVKFEKWLQ